MDSHSENMSLTSLFRPMPETSPMAMTGFCTDVARKIDDADVIATRYGFVDKAHIKAWLGAHPGVTRRIKEERAVWESSGNIETKTRTLAATALTEGIPTHAQIMLNPDVPPGIRIDAFKELAKVAGVSGLAPVARVPGSGGQSADASGRFSVQIVFASENRVEAFTTREPPAVTIEAQVEEA